MAKAVILRELCKKIGCSISQFEREIGAGSGTIVKAISKDAEISGSILLRIRKKYPLVSETWLETGDGEIFKKELEISYNNNNKLLKNGIEEATEEYRLMRELIEEKDKRIELLEENMKLLKALNKEKKPLRTS